MENDMLTVSIVDVVNFTMLVVLLVMAWNQKRLSDKVDELDIAHQGLETFVIELLNNLSKGHDDNER